VTSSHSTAQRIGFSSIPGAGGVVSRLTVCAVARAATLAEATATADQPAGVGIGQQSDLAA
jgi:hypothetical protein